MTSRMDLMDLARHLRQESLFVSSERQNLQHLNEKVIKTVERLYHSSWIARQQRLNLDNLILSHTDSHPAVCCQRANSLENVNFLDSYKQLGINDCAYSEFLQQFRDDPKLVAMCLNAGEKVNISAMHNVVNIIMAALYGNCVLPEDEIHTLNILKELMALQLAISDNPRRLLRHGSCAFSRVYKIFNECLFSAKLFLTAALHEPIMHLLMEDDLFLDIDPSKAAVRFHPQERLRHFGKEGTQEYTANLQRYRNWTINKLVNITTRFIEGIRNNLYCFPQSLSWLARQMYNLVMKAKRVEVREVGAMCADLVFAFFICPAIVNPEPYGITDIPISYIARFNLMQVAQILQVLAMSKWEEIDPKLMDLYGKFEKDCMSSLLDLILEGSTSDSPSDLVNQFQEMTRSAVLITESELMSLVSFLRSVEAETHDNVLKKMIFSLVDTLPTPQPVISNVVQNGNITSTPNANSADNVNLSSAPSMKRSLISKVSRRSSKLPMNSVAFSESHSEDSGGVQDSDTSSPSTKAQLENVLVVPIHNVEFECPGMLAEEKVLVMEQHKKQHRVIKSECLNGEESDTVSCGPEIVEKRTRFSLSQDQESVGTSDNLEAISEAASNHSVASSLDLENENDENENDNLSDMVSANVSGRGTPNVSGRDTPSSQLEGEEREQRPLDLMAATRKQNQEDIEDKFGKFEIQPMIEGDETKSMVSDTWSTDVLASDSETVEQSDISSQVALEPQNLSLLDTSETASQSDAWSTDVMASDTERLQDVDTDDTASVARSDDTARSEVDGDVSRGVDVTQNDGKDVVGDGLIEPLVSGIPGKPYGCNTEFPLFMPQGFLNSANKLPEFPELMDSENDIVPPSEKSSIEEMKKRNVRAPVFKVSELLCVEVENHDDVSTMKVNNLQSSPKESLSSMQSLGRVSLAVKELPDVDDQDSGSLLLDSLQETVIMRNDSSGQPHRSSIADILSLDLTRTLNLHVDMGSCEDPKSDSGCSMTDLEGDMINGEIQTDKELNSEFPKADSFPMKNVTHIERPAKRKFPDFSQVEDISPRLSAVSVSSSGSSSIGSSEMNSHVSSSVDANEHGLFYSEEHLVSREPRHSAAAPSMGAIPKSISFDKAVGSIERHDMDDKMATDKNRKSLFKLSGFRFTFKGRNRKSPLAFRQESGSKGSEEMSIVEDRPLNFRQSQATLAEMRSSQLEAGDEILAKYRKKTSCLLPGAVLKPNDVTDISSGLPDNVLDGPQVFEPANLENSAIFYDAKRKLRLVLGSADFQTLPWLSNSPGRPHVTSGQRPQDNELVAFLRVLLAEAINLQQRPLMAHLHEALRCIRMFDDIGCQKLFKSLKDDYKKRSPYVAYLVRCRQGLLSTLAHLETLIDRIERDKQVCNQYLVMMCVRIFLEKHDRRIQHFVRRFQELTVSDEKAILVENFLNILFSFMESDSMWQTSSETQIEHAQIVIERMVMSQIYTSALYPNGDGDVLRDKVLHEHMQKLLQVITPNHKDLRIPKIYHSECPWPSAQAELVTINAYKTPRDKLQCVLRCCSTIMNLLSMASDKFVPAADDLMPVLVFVLIKANPPNLLSTIQYVNTFYEKHLEGEEAYWWTQFCSGVEFIKTMDY